jgi:ABC-type glycerol-3-phosphate transport system permease component
MTTSFITPRWCITAAALTVTAILLSSFYWVLVGSFMTPAELFSGHLWPKHLAVENWSDALSRLWPHIQNSLLVSAVACIGTLLITAPASYGIVWRKPELMRCLIWRTDR